MSSKISVLEQWAFGITIVIGGQFFSWNFALAAGLAAFLFNFVLVAFGYLSLCCCLGEMASALQAPFAGALFCFTRAAFGRVFGFFVASLEVLEYVGYVASTVLVLGAQLTYVFGTDPRFEPLWWLMFFLLSCPVYLKGLSWFWKFNVIVALVMIFQLVIYFILAVSTPACSISYAVHVTGFGGFQRYASSLPDVIWLFVGVEGLTLVNEKLINHHFTYKGMIYCCLTLMVTATFTIFGVVTNPPGIEELSSAVYPLNYVLQYYGATSRGATWFTVFPTFATAFGFVFLYTTLINSLARSAVIPEWIGNKPSESPIRAMLTGSVVVYIIMLIGWLSTDNVTITGTLFSVYQIAAVAVYLVQIATFGVMRTDFVLLRTWNSPLGIPGAVVGFVIFGFVLMCLVLRQEYAFKWLFFGIWFAAVTVYYYFWGQYTKPASEEEIRAMFRMHTMRTNRLRHKHVYRECQKCEKNFCTGCRKKGSNHRRNHIARLVGRFTEQGFTCWNCRRASEVGTNTTPRSREPSCLPSIEASRSSNSSHAGLDDLEGEQIEAILMAHSLDKKCIVTECGCRTLKIKGHEQVCDCGHLAIYHESIEEALGLTEHGAWKRIMDVPTLEKMLLHTQLAKASCIQAFDHKIDGLKHRIAHLKQNLIREAKLADIKANQNQSNVTNKSEPVTKLNSVVELSIDIHGGSTDHQNVTRSELKNEPESQSQPEPPRADRPITGTPSKDTDNLSEPEGNLCTSEAFAPQEKPS